MSRRVTRQETEQVQACPVPEIDLSRVAEVLEEVDPRAGLITVLQKLQAIYGYLPEVVVDEVSRRSGVAASRIYGIITFYAQFTTEPSGRYKISVCQGTACHVAGAPLIIDAFEEATGVTCGCTSEDGLFTLEGVNCVGACALAPVVRVGEDETHGRMTPDAARDLVADLRTREVEE
jgi:NADH:ubiquinone oxidoreductase subunit E